MPNETFEITSMLYGQRFFCDRLNLKPYPRFDLSSRPCYHKFTSDQFLWIKICWITMIEIAFALLHLFEISLGRERELRNNGITYETYFPPFDSSWAVFQGGSVRCVYLAGWKMHPCNRCRIFLCIYCRRKSSCLIFCRLAPHCSLPYWTVILQPNLHGPFFFCKRISRQWSHELCIFAGHTRLWHRVVREWMGKVFCPLFGYSPT